MDPKDEERLKSLNNATFDALSASDGSEAVSAALEIAHEYIQALLEEKKALTVSRGFYQAENELLEMKVKKQGDTIVELERVVEDYRRVRDWERQITYSRATKVSQIGHEFHKFVQTSGIENKTLNDLVYALRNITYVSDQELVTFCKESLYEEHVIKGVGETIACFWEELEAGVWTSGRTVAGRGTLNTQMIRARQKTIQRVADRNKEVKGKSSA